MISMEYILNSGIKEIILDKILKEYRDYKFLIDLDKYNL